MRRADTLIFIPTFNEAGNVGRLYEQIRKLNLDLAVLFLDDNSPDGTGAILDQIARDHPDVSVIHRVRKLGIGTAHQEGIRHAYEHGYDVLITMDSDLTHSPANIPEFLAQKERADIVVGSRYMRNESLATWNRFRKVLTHAGHFLTVTFLDMPYDASGAFRLYNLKSIDQRTFSMVRSTGYSFFFESLFVLNFNRKKIVEIPIDLPSREYGTSKMSWKDIWRSLVFLIRLYVRKVFSRESLVVGAHSSSAT
jgi:dolichol-phosphate mannosyltransferase